MEDKQPNVRWQTPALSEPVIWRYVDRESFCLEISSIGAVSSKTDWIDEWIELKGIDILTHARRHGFEIPPHLMTEELKLLARIYGERKKSPVKEKKRKKNNPTISSFLVLPMAVLYVAIGAGVLWGWGGAYLATGLCLLFILDAIHNKRKRK